MNFKFDFRFFCLIFLLFWFGFFLIQKIDFTTADLGRFLKNGEAIFDGNFAVLKTNFYSFTYPDFPFINHHWLSGAVFYFFFQISGFWGLHLFFVILSFITFLIFYRLAEKESNTQISFILSLFLVPLIAYRNEIRPEVFSYFFAAIFFWILWHYRKGVISYYPLFILPFFEILWVNLHIYFFLGPIIIGVFLLEKIILFFKSKNKLAVKKLFLVFIFSLATALLNPFGLKGILYPLTIFKNRGYRVLEEQSVWFLEKVNINMPAFLLFKIAIFVLIISFILVLIKDRQRFSLVNLFLASGFSFMALVAIRNFVLFGLFALPIIAFNLKNCSLAKFLQLKKLVAALVLVAFLGTILIYGRYLPFYWQKWGLGLWQNVEGSARFFEENGLAGPVFNNYDIGGYLIFYLFPKERVFVDNRPEAYPASFFKKIYIPMQEQEDIWQKFDTEYKFNSIFFYRLDATPWAQPFLIRRLDDQNWAPVFVDESTIIFLKNKPENQEIIEKYRIPKEYFRVIKID